MPASSPSTQPPSAEETQRYRDNLQAEIDGIALYQALAEIESSPELATVYVQLAESEERHAALWREKLRANGQPVEDPAPGWRTRAMIGLARRFGTGLILPTVRTHEQADSHRYDAQPEAHRSGLPAEERSHARLFEAIGKGSSTGMVGSALAQLEGRHSAAGGNALRAAVLGANDGLVSNISLVMGVAGADLVRQNILVTGMAGLLAGSLSMALGEWLSVQSARELYTHQLEIERQELAEFPDEELEELSLIYQAKGLSEADARALATQIFQDEETALDTMAREELNIDPEDLGGSAWVAAITSFILFSIGAIIPVLPYFFTGGMAAVAASVGLSAVALYAIGAGITIITGKNAVNSGLRQVVFGVAAAAITYGVGSLFGVGLG
jgi:vacuolar iron transporter family protein